MQHKELFTPVRLGELELNNRILMAPLTRCRCEANHVPSDMMIEYYTQRANAGLIIAEATMAIKGNSAFGMREPGIYSEAQIIAWKKITDAVHEKGGKMVLQLWHGGRACHSLLNGGSQPVAPSELPISNDETHTPEGKKPYEIPRALEIEEIPAIIEGFKIAAMNAKKAGFDGVEVHGANGYLLDEFLRDGTNKRTDIYGGSIENRARLLLEVVDAVITVWGAGRVAVRISPLNSFNDMIDSDPIALTKYVGEQLDQRKIAFLDLMRADLLGIQQADILNAARQSFKGAIIGNMGYSPEEAVQNVKEGVLEGVAFGRSYISNPDLVARIKAGAILTEPDQSTFYGGDEKGYTDYPPMTE
jgi:N-ethylmaleimide reductase